MPERNIRYDIDERQSTLHFRLKKKKKKEKTLRTFQ
jgi:hypothetical protein